MNRRAAILYADKGGVGTGAWLSELSRALPHVQFIAVADSVEGASEVLRAAAVSPNVRHLQLETRLGKGAALRAGFNATAAELVAFVSMDGTLAASEIDGLFDSLEQSPDADGIVADRFGGSYEGSARRRLSSSMLNAFSRALFGLKMRDPQSPLKVFRRAAIVRIFEDLRLYDRGFDVELLFQAKRQHLRLEERPVVWRAIEECSPSLGTGISVAFALLLLRLAHSPLSRIPAVYLLGRNYHVPVKRSYSIMVFCWRDPKNPAAGGGEVYLHEQARWWIKAGHKVTWFAQRFEGAPKRETVDGIEVVRWGGFPSVFLLGGVWYLTRETRDFDFIIDCMNGIPFFTPLFSTKPKCCLIYHVHSHHFKSELPPVIGAVASFVETKLVPVIYSRTRFLTISPSTKEEMEQLHMSRLPIGLVHSGVDPSATPGKRAAVPTVLYLGRIKKYKRVRKLIDAFAAVKHDVPDARLVIAGTGDDLDDLKQYAREAGCGGIEFTGRVSEEEKVRLMQEAWVFGMPSSIEGWGIVVIEANACATPCIVYDVNGLRDCVVDGKTGYIVDTDAEYEARLRALLTDGALRERLSAQALQWSRNFSWAKTAERTLEQIRLSQPWRAVFEPVEGTGLSIQPTYMGRRDLSGRRSK